MTTFYWILWSTMVLIVLFKIALSIERLIKAAEITALHETCKTAIALKDSGVIGDDNEEFLKSLAKIVMDGTHLIVLGEQDEQ